MLRRLRCRHQALRQTTLDLNNALVAFRRVVRRSLGAHHRDYQKLRVASVRRDDPDDELDPAEPADPVEPAEPVEPADPVELADPPVDGDAPTEEAV